jgi:nicotinamide mononucleotide transporter
MDTVIQAIEVFAMVTGVVYLVLEILQKNSMWVVGILTSTACAFEFAITHVWASMGLNIYYVAMSVIGLLQWRKASEAVGEGEIHLSRLPRTVALWSAALFVLGSLVLMQVLRATGDPAPGMDAVAVTLSIIATWWLAQSYLQQWLLWIVADIFTTTICLTTGQYWMAVLYTAYIASAVYGYFHWKRKGKYVSLDDGVKRDSSLRSE